MTHVRIEIATTVGTKYADNLSANFWIGACKRWTISLFRQKQKDYQRRVRNEIFHTINMNLDWILGVLDKKIYFQVLLSTYVCK